MSFYFMRHGLAWRTLEGVCAGALECSGLTPEGREAVVARLKSLAADLRFDRVVTSPIRRAQETALFLSQNFETDSLWREREYGEWEGVSFESVKHRLTALETPPGGESHDDFTARVIQALDTYACTDQNILVISHGGVWQAMHDAARTIAPWIEPGDLYQVNWLPGANRLTTKII
jgi:broad specificity phosphatase PhoE